MGYSRAERYHLNELPNPAVTLSQRHNNEAYNYSNFRLVFGVCLLRQR